MADLRPTDLPPIDPKRRAPRWMRWTLIASLALNLAVLGVVVGAVVNHMSGDSPRPPSVRSLDLGAYSAALSPEDRRAMREAFRAEWPGLRQMRARQAETTAAILAALRADPFDAAALRAQLAAQRARVAEGHDLGQRLLMERLEAMTAPERAAFADRLEERLTRPGHSSGHRPRDND